MLRQLSLATVIVLPSAWLQADSCDEGTPPPMPDPWDIVVSPGEALCPLLTAAPSGSQIVLAPGVHTSDCVWRAAGEDVTVIGDDATVEGALVCYDCHGWRFDGLTVVGAGSASGRVVGMIGGRDWRWTRCDISNAGQLGVYAMFGVGFTDATTAPVRWRLDHCYLHDNGTHPDHDDNQNHLAYILGKNGTDMDAFMEDNLFVHATGGFMTKIGGTGNEAGEGSDTVTYQRNVLVQRSLTNGACDLLLTTGSDRVTVRDNVFWCQQTEGGQALSHIRAATWYGTELSITDNVFWGYDPGLTPPRPILVSTTSALGAVTFYPLDINDCGAWATCSGNVQEDPGFPAPEVVNPDPSPWGGVPE